MKRLARAQFIAGQVAEWKSKNKNRTYSEEELIIQAAYRALEIDMVQMVEDFHHHFSISYNGKPRALPTDVAEFRRKFVQEELNEWETHSDGARFQLTQRETSDMFDPDAGDKSLTHHLDGMLDALCDLLYVTLGTAHLQGFNIREAFLRVHRANMAKIINERPKDANDAFKSKIAKPEGWQAPDHTDLVADHAHKDQT